MARPIIMFPDFRGQQAKEFGAKLGALYPSSIIVPVLNGPDRKELEAVYDSCSGGLINPLLVNGQGLLAATLEAYEALARLYPHNTIVKIDTAEHPPEKIGLLAERAESINGFVVGDLTFTDETLPKGTPDWYAHVHTFPVLYSVATSGKLALSCAHGFQAFAPLLCQTALKSVRGILLRFKGRFGELPKWGLDGAMAIACTRLGYPVQRIGIPALSVRNRAADKVDQQVRAHLQMVIAAEQYFG